MTDNSSTFFAHFRQIRDPWIDHAKRHLLIGISFIAMCTIICGGEGFTERIGAPSIGGWLRPRGT